MIPLLLCYRSEKAAAKRRHEINRWAAPNTHVLHTMEIGQTVDQRCQSKAGLR